MAIATVVPPDANAGPHSFHAGCAASTPPRWNPTLVDVEPAVLVNVERIAASVDVEHADAIAREAARLLGHDVVPIARAAARLVEHEEWAGFGYARQDDFAVEWLGRSGRWLRQSAALGRAIARWPQLAKALEGRDGGPQLGALAALEVARVARATGGADAVVRAWIAVARRVTLRALRDTVAAALDAECGAAPRVDPVAEDGDRVRVTLPLPASVREVFEDVLALHRVVEGYEATVSSFIEALCAELGGGPGGPASDDELRAVRPGPTIADRERAAELCTACKAGSSERDPPAWRDHRGSDADGILSLAERELRAARELLAEDAAGGVDDTPSGTSGVAPRLLALLRVEQCLHNVIGRMLALLGSCRAWRRLGCADMGHYAERRLGMSRTLATDCARIARVAVRVPQLANDWAAALIGTSAARHVARVLGTALQAGADDALGADPNLALDTLAAAWVDFAQSATVKRIRDEAEGALSAWRRLRRGVRAPSPDDSWRRSLRDPRSVDAARIAENVQAEIAAGTVVITDDLHLTLDRDLASRFLAALDRAGASRLHTFAATDPSHTRWVGLLEALASYASSWAPRGPARNRPCRCDAPGCTARGNIHEHHVTYRARGGTDDGANKVDLCAFHHLRGEHGGLMQVRGTAPDDLVYRLGPEGNAQWYRNERRINAPDR